VLLADLGADVVKVEDPRGGDGMRTLPPLASGRNVYFEALNRNKRSLTLDLRSPDAAAVLAALAARSDVMVDSFRPSTARRLGWIRRPSAPDIRAWCAPRSAGSGQSGPYVERAAHDINYQALAGLLRPPALPGPLIGDIGAAMQTTVGILAALIQRHRTGIGSIVDVSISRSRHGMVDVSNDRRFWPHALLHDLRDSGRALARVGRARAEVLGRFLLNASAAPT